jgi:hypothetical protein
MGVRVLKTPVRAPKANAVCEAAGRDDPTGVPGLPDPVWGAASETSADELGRPLQSRSGSH